MANERFVRVGTTPHPHEDEGIAFAQSVLPNVDAFALFELRDRNGHSNEIDILVIGHSAIYLVEMKHYGGIIDGDSVDWEWTPPGDSRALIRKAPYSLANLKAKILKSRLEQVMRDSFAVPYVQPLIFLSNPEVEIRLTGDARTAVVGRAGLAPAIIHGKIPNVDSSRFRPISSSIRRELLKALATIGIKPRKGMLKAGEFMLGSVIEEGPGFQDREAVHEKFPDNRQRARVYLVPNQTTAEHRQRLTRAAEREVQLLYLVREHPGILHSTTYVADGPLGPTLLFEDFEGGVSLDRFVVREQPNFDEKFEIFKQVAYALSHCHHRNVHHGGLCPHAVLARRRDGKLEIKLYNLQFGGSDEHSVTQQRSLLAGLIAYSGRLYQAPELDQNPNATTASSDTFSLGALAYWLFTSSPPASNPSELAQKLQRDQYLDPTAVSDDLPESLINGIIEATRLEHRIDSPLELFELIRDDLFAELEAQRKAKQIERPESTALVLEADKGDLLIMRFEVLRVLGTGASARVLEVKDLHNNGNHYALKVARDEENDDRLLLEAAVLREIDDPRIVRLHEELNIQGRTCLLLSLAGDRSLQQLIAEEGTLDLDLASRYGEDLLRALEVLEEKEGAIHRDIKPANLGVGYRKKGLARHLTLFDFSLASAARDDLDVGTPPYRDPWLRSEGRGVWDHAADRWSAAITLHEMLTGVRPEFSPRGVSPLATHAKLEIMAERFDASNRDRLILFFEKALAREVGARFPTAEKMTRSWAACFDEVVRVAGLAAAAESSEPTEAEQRRGTRVTIGTVTAEQIAAIQPGTEIRALPLSSRALNALDRAGLHVAEELLALPNNRLSAIRGVGSKVLTEILDLRNRWRAHLGEREATTAFEPFYPDFRGAEIELGAAGDLDLATVASLEDAGLHTTTTLARAPRIQVEAIVHRAHGEVERLRALLAGLDMPAPGGEPGDGEPRDARPTTLEAWIAALFPGDDKPAKRIRMLFGLEGAFFGLTGTRLQEVADAEGISRQRMHQLLANSVERWRLQPWRDPLRALALDVVDALDGVTTLDDAVLALRPRIPCEMEISPSVHDARLAALLRAACELGADGDERRVELRWRTRATRSVLWLISNPELWTTIEALGRRADALADREPLAATAETARALQDVVDGTDLSATDSARVLDLAAAASRHAARSSRLEIYPIGMAPERALELSAQALSAPRLTAEQVQHRVRARYPEAAPLPERPALDDLLAAHGLHFDASADAYIRITEPSEQSSVTSVSLHRFDTTQPANRIRNEAALEAQDFEDLVRAVRQDRKLRVLGVEPAYFPGALSELERVLDTQAIALDQRLIAAMEQVIVAKRGKPAALWRADAAGREGPNWPSLVSVAVQAAEQIAAELLPPREPVLLVQLGLLARYGLSDFLDKLVAAAQDDRSEAIVLVNTVFDDGRSDVIADTLPIPGLLAGQTAKIPIEWIENRHRGAPSHS